MADLASLVASLDDCYTRWRFGSHDARDAGIGLARDILESGADPVVVRSAHLRLALMLLPDSPVQAEDHLSQARALGADIPRSVARDEANAPPSARDDAVDFDFDVQVVEPASSRDFTPALGDGWHPAFDLVTVALPALQLAVLRDGYISVDTTQGRPQVYIFDANGRLIPPFSTGTAPFRDPPILCDGPLVLLDDAFGSFNVCHTLFDKLPRLAQYERRFPDARLVGLMFQDTAYYRQALDDLGHDLMAVPASGRFTVRAATLAVLSNHRRGEILHPGFSGSSWASRFIAERFQPAEKGRRRLYLSRDDAHVRRVVNEDQVRLVFQDHGFEIHTLSHLDYAQQRGLFAEAGWMAGVHGAGLANMAFAAPGTGILEIMPPLAGTHAYWVMAQALGQPYTLFTADDAELTVQSGATFDPALGARSIRVDPERLDRALRDWLA